MFERQLFLHTDAETATFCKDMLHGKEDLIKQLHTSSAFLLDNITLQFSLWDLDIDASPLGWIMVWHSTCLQTDKWFLMEIYGKNRNRY